MHFDEQSQAFVVSDDCVFPVRFFITEDCEVPPYEGKPDGYTTHVRVCRGTFENRWSLSIIWGSMTYSDNYHHPFGDWRDHTVPEFTDEPELVEVGIIMPEPIVKPGYTIDLPNWKGPATLPAHDVELWGDPLGYVDAEGLRWVMQAVSHFDSHEYNPHVNEGPYLEQDDDGHYSLSVTFKDQEVP